MSFYPPKEMYESMTRAYDELMVLNKPTKENILKNTIEARYAAWNFFSRAYHFKDWLKKDSIYRKIAKVESFVSKSESLILAADYCNANKHAGLDRRPRSGKVVGRLNTHTIIDFLPTGAHFESRLEIEFGEQKHDVFDLATKCIKEWDNFIKVNKINLN